MFLIIIILINQNGSAANRVHVYFILFYFLKEQSYKSKPPKHELIYWRKNVKKESH